MKLLPLITAVTAFAVCGKEARTFYDSVRVDEARARVRRHEWARDVQQNVLQSCEWHLQLSLDECWELVPPAEQLRAINVSHGIGCPDCGDKIFRKAGHYPWTLDREHPFQVQCPVCERRFPERDFVPWNPLPRETAPEQGTPVRDRGVGWQDEAGNRYWFVAYYLFWQRWRQDITRAVHRLGQAYLLTDDPNYARRAAVILAKVASQYTDFHYEEQVYHEGIWGIRGRISDYIWSCGDNSALALAYDAVYPIFGNDPELDRFLASKITKHPCRLIENNMLQVMVDDIMRGYVAGNMGMHQRTLAELAIVLANDDPAKGKTSEDMRTWLMAGPGRIEDLLWNGFWRDGLGGESSPSYASGWGAKFYDLAELLPRLGLDIWSNPKLRKMADVGPDMLVAGQFTPCIGDCGGVRGAKNVGLTPVVHGPAFRRYGDPKYAAALARINARNRDLWSPGFNEKTVEKHAPQGQLGGATRVLGGYGLAILESGREPWRRGLSLYYGDATGGHGHYDRLTLGFFALGYPMFCEMGYPTPFRTPKRFGWTSNSASHLTVLIDERRQRNRYAGTLHGLASVNWVHGKDFRPGSAQWVDASAENVYPQEATLYRRQTALVEIDKSRSYVLDVFRVNGGKQHDWCFHGPAFTGFDVSGLTLGPTQEKGTLAGEDVPFGSLPPDRENQESNGFEFLYNIRRARPDGAWSCTWRNPADNTCLTTHVPGGTVQEVILAHAKPEMQPGNPEFIHVGLGRNRYPETPAVSTFISVSEPHRGTAAIQSVRTLKPIDGAGTAAAVAVDRGTETDFIHTSLDVQPVRWETSWGTFEASAPFALVTVDEQGPARAVILNGEYLKFGDTVVEPEHLPPARILSVDLFENKVTTDAVMRRPDIYEQTAVIFSNERHSTAYMIEKIEMTAEGAVLHLGHTPLRVGMGEVADIEPAKNIIQSDRPLAGYGRIENGRHQGRWLANESGQCVGRIHRIDSKTLELDHRGVPLDAGAFPDADGDGRTLYWISEVGPGDHAYFATAAIFVQR